MQKQSIIPKTYINATFSAYIIAFALIFIISLFAQLTIQYFIAENKLQSQTINIAGRQRMLSQRIALYTLHFDKNQTKEVREKVASDLDMLKQSHQDLISGNEEKGIQAPFNHEIHKNMIELSQELNSYVSTIECILENCEEQERAHKEITNQAEVFLAKMNKIVFEASEASQEDAKNLARLELIFFGLICLAMLGELLVILIPFRKRMMAVLDEKMRQQEQHNRLYHLAEMGEISSEILHEVKNFITIIDGASKLLVMKTRNKEELKEIQPQIDKIENGVRRVTNICKSASSLSRISYVSDFKLSDIETEITELFSDRTERQHIDLNFHLEEDEKVQTNKAQVIQILFNLIKNAAQAIDGQEEQYIDVSILTKAHLIEIQVKDNGKSIPDEVRQNIFNAFFTTKAEGVGTGLGLSLSRKIAQALGGDLVLLDCPTTTFQLTVENKLLEHAKETVSTLKSAA